MVGVALGAAFTATAQDSPVAPDNGMREHELRIHAITGATIVRLTEANHRVGDHRHS